MKRFFVFACLILGVSFPLVLHAKIYFINKGVKYHIGDNHFATSEDSDFLGAFPVVGQEWLQGFTVSQADKVKVHIGKIWGVDDCDYCKVFVAIDGHDMLRLSQANNGGPIDTLTVLAMTLQPGVTHVLKIASIGRDKVDDFMIEDVSVETQVAEIEFVAPRPFETAEPTPEPQLPKVPCESAEPKVGWMKGEAEGKTGFELESKGRDGQDSGVLGSLAPGEALDFYVQIAGLPASHDAVGHALEFLLTEPAKEGWVLSLKEGQGSGLHGNMIRDGIYRAEAFSAGPWKPSGWNHIRIQSCSDGYIHLQVNGGQATVGLKSGLRAHSFMFRAVGIKAVISKRPEAPTSPSPLGFPAPGGF
jgi:hypothetical protein